MTMPVASNFSGLEIVSIVWLLIWLGMAALFGFMLARGLVAHFQRQRLWFTGFPLTIIFAFVFWLIYQQIRG